MKNRLDAPSTDDIVQVRQSVRGDALFEPSAFGARVQAEYGKQYGVSDQGRRSALPRRVLPKEHGVSNCSPWSQRMETMRNWVP